MKDKKGEGVIQVNLCDIKVFGPLQKDGCHLVVDELEMKEGYEKYKAHKVNAATTVTPLINLDLYGHLKGESGIKRIDKAGIEVKVSIPINLITSNTKVKDINNIELFIYDGEWINANKLSGISGLVQNKGSIDFTITTWPTDDRMIASGP